MSRITVVIRVKPEKTESTLKNFNHKGDKTIDITVPNGGRHEFTFDHIFGMESSQASIFNAHSHLVNKVLEGFNGSIIAYGQTGAGKVSE
jgi:kinesin family member 5